MKSLKYILCAMLAVSSLMYGDMSEVRTRAKFDRLLHKRSIVVALFYKSNRETRKNKDLSLNIAELERMFKRVAEEDRYKDAKIMFVRVNVIGTDAQDLADEYGVESLPAFMLFKEGRPVRGAEKGSLAMKTGFIRGYTLQLFIDEYLGETINTYVQINAERNRRRERTHSTYTYVGYGYGAYPYYGSYGYPYYGGSVGFGFSF